MIRSRGARITGFAVAVGATAALIAFGVSSTGAYFTDSVPGTVDATMGSIDVSSPNTTIAFTKMLPGEPQSKTVSFSNTGANTQDVWVVFNPTDLNNGMSGSSAAGINTLGAYGGVDVSSSMRGAIFHSGNLSDQYRCYTPTNPFPDGTPRPDICPLPAQILLASNVVPTAAGTFTFTFTPGTEFKNGAQSLPVFPTLDYKIVATQHNIAPNDVQNNPITWP